MIWSGRFACSGKVMTAHRGVIAASDSRDRCAKQLEGGHTTTERAETVVEAAEDDPDEYGPLVEQMDRSGKVSGAFRSWQVLKQTEMIERDPPQLPPGRFQLIVADPPWRYESGGDLPYPTMATEEIKALPVSEVVAADAVLWLWTANAHLQLAFEVVEAWGFECETMLTWVKDRMGTGEWLRGQTEHCLLAARGRPVFRRGESATALPAPRREHSRKPEEFYQLVEGLCAGRRLEMFARELRVGWQAHGLIAPELRLQSVDDEVKSSRSPVL